MADPDKHRASRELTAKLLDPAANVSAAELRAALANALQRVDALEQELEGLGEAFHWFNENTPSLGPR